MAFSDVFLLPVIDLLDGVVVHGVGGHRDTYHPIQSSLCGSSAPATVARVLRQRTGTSQLYVADLNALRGETPQWTVYAELLSDGAGLWLDAGPRTLVDVRQLCDFQAEHVRIEHVILALETWPAPEELSSAVNILGSERAVFSWDMKNGHLWTQQAAWLNRPWNELLDLVVESGISKMIVLDVAAVGSQSGPATLACCQQLRERHPQLTIVGGGGIRDWSDVKAFQTHGCNGVLVATAIHEGRM